MKTPIFLAGCLALAAFILFPRNAMAQNAPGNYGGNSNGGSPGNVAVAIPRVSVAYDYRTGLGGIRYVTVQAPVVQRQQIARQFFSAGGVRVGGNQNNGNARSAGTRQVRSLTGP